MKENGFILKKARSRQSLAENIMDTDNADDIALFANTPTQSKCLPHSLEVAAGCFGLHLNADKTEYISPL